MRPDVSVSASLRALVKGPAEAFALRPFPAYHRLGILADHAVGLVPEARDANVERCPLGDRPGNVVTVIVGDQRAFHVDRVAMIFRTLGQMLDPPIRHQPRERPARLGEILADRKRVQIPPAGLQRTPDFGIDLGRIENMLHHVEREDQIERVRFERLAFQIFIAEPADDGPQGLTWKKVGRDVTWRLARHPRGEAALGGR
jgi:hypothetical protein